MSDEEDDTEYLLDDALLVTDAEIELGPSGSYEGNSETVVPSTSSAIDALLFPVDKALTLQYLTGKLW